MATPLVTRQQLRQQIRSLRQGLNSKTQALAAEKIAQQLQQHPHVIHAKNIALYLANDGELSPLPFIHWCWQNNKNVYLPVLHPFSSGHLLFLHYTKTTEMIDNKYGISEPKLNVNNIILPQHLDIIFTPLVAFDNQGNRLGMGGGFYDRTLSALKKQTNSTQIIGLAHQIQLLPAIPVEVWDEPLPEIITPEQCYCWREA